MRNLILSVLLILGDIGVDAQAAEYHQVYPNKAVIAYRGTDFLSPCLEGVNLMGRIIPTAGHRKWTGRCVPQLFKKSFSHEPVTKRELEWQ